MASKDAFPQLGRNRSKEGWGVRFPDATYAAKSAQFNTLVAKKKVSRERDNLLLPRQNVGQLRSTEYMRLCTDIDIESIYVYGIMYCTACLPSYAFFRHNMNVAWTACHGCGLFASLYFMLDFHFSPRSVYKFGLRGTHNWNLLLYLCTCY